METLPLSPTITKTVFGYSENYQKSSKDIYLWTTFLFLLKNDIFRIIDQKEPTSLGELP